VTSVTEPQAERAPLPEQPFVSVLVPVRNEEGFIGRCLTALAGQDYPRERFEVIVIDGESDDSTDSEVRTTADAMQLTVLFVPNPKLTTASGLNLGLAYARGEVIVRVDGHTRVAQTFLSAAVTALRETDADAVGGPIETRGHGTVGRAIALAMSSPFGVGDNAFRAGDVAEWTDTVPFAAYRRDVFERAGFFDESMNRGEDDEFNYRLRAAGGRILLTPEVRSVYFARDSFEGLAKQYWGYGVAKVAVLKRHPRRLRWRHLIPPALVLALAGGPVLSTLDRRFAWLTALAGAAYGAATALATLRMAKRAGVKEASLLPVAFGCIHLPAGAGMIAGVWRLLRPERAEELPPSQAHHHDHDHA
jgi:cellulose synthase/poly-beta-1,6-N-acetylglucosamine synthase-like glycosyltransferase